MKNKPYRILQITDCHLGSQPGESLLGLNTDQSLADVLRLLKQQESPDLILSTGDISNDAGPKSYQRFIDIVRQYFPDTPLAWLPGNHDDPMNMDQVSELPIEAHYIAAGWNLILLDSRIPMEEGGEINDEEMARFAKELDEHSHMPTMVFLHHQPVPVGSVWIDQYVLANADKFFQLTDQYDNIKAICWGHIHQEFSQMRKGVELMATPSTCVQFAPKEDEFKVDYSMPGYRRIELFCDGTYKTQVLRVAQKAYNIDYASLGY